MAHYLTALFKKERPHKKLSYQLLFTIMKSLASPPSAIRLQSNGLPDNGLGKPGS
uniref:Uncharacterized protein n=1 Tax=Anguilla anguilla TaxID=7936 RepID=A0A0E9T099_ANGAN